MTLKHCTLLALTLAALLAPPASGVSLFLDSWGISYNQWQPVGAQVDRMVYMVEDYLPGGDGFLGPGYGGQEYDIEAAYMALDEESLYIGIVTGFPLAGRWHGSDYYAPGDIGLDLTGDGVYDFAVDVDAEGALRTGDLVWENPAVAGGPAWGGAADPLRVTSWTSSAGLTPGSFRYGSFHSRYALEAVIDLDLLGGPANNYMMHWTMGCGNDLAELTTAPVPEPATLLLLGVGLAMGGAAARRRRRA